MRKICFNSTPIAKYIYIIYYIYINHFYDKISKHIALSLFNQFIYLLKDKRIKSIAKAFEIAILLYNILVMLHHKTKLCFQ